MMVKIRALGFLLAGLALSTLPAAAQVDSAQRLLLTRGDLQMQLEEMELIAADASYPGYERDGARSRAEAIRARLEQGDFRQGYRISVQANGLPGTDGLPGTPLELVVEPGPSVLIPDLPRISLVGILRSELESYLTEELSEYFVDPRVRASGLLRLSVVGGVGAPGFYNIRADALVYEAITEAGGFAGGSTYEDAEIQRAGRTIWEGDELRDAIEGGETLDALHLLDGDQLVIAVPNPGGGLGQVWQILIGVGTAVLVGLILGNRGGGGGG